MIEQMLRGLIETELEKVPGKLTKKQKGYLLGLVYTSATAHLMSFVEAVERESTEANVILLAGRARALAERMSVVGGFTLGDAEKIKKLDC